MISYIRGISVTTDDDEICSDSEFYDTDLEDAEDGWKDAPKETTFYEIETEPITTPVKRETSSVELYERSCSSLRVAPASKVTSQLDSTHMGVAYRNIGPTGAVALAKALSVNTTICSLDLTDGGIFGKGAAYIADAILKKDGINTVNVSGNFLGKGGAIVIGELMRRSKAITHLNLSCNMIADSEMDMISSGIKTNEKIVSLNMSGNALSEFGAAKLGKALALNSVIESIDLSWNKIRRSGAVGICKGIQDNISLTEVNLSWNGLGYEGALAIGQVLRNNDRIRVLDLSNNRLQWKEALLISRGLKVNSTLEELYLDENPLTTTGCMDLIDAVSQATCGLLFLSLKGVSVIQDFEILASAIKQARNFSYRHGGIVNSHDVLGERHDKRVEPMRRVLDYMKERGMRPTELFRSFDKAVAHKMSADHFVERLKKAGISMPKHEVEELMGQFDAPLPDTKDSINYKKMSRSVNQHIEKERMERIQEREEGKRLKRYHKDILTQELPPIRDIETPDSAVGIAVLSLDDVSGRISEVGSSRLLNAAQSTSRSAAGKQTKLPVISMSRPLGAKTKPFGKGNKKKKVGKATKKKRKSKK